MLSANYGVFQPPDESVRDKWHRISSFKTKQNKNPKTPAPSARESRPQGLHLPLDIPCPVLYLVGSACGRTEEICWNCRDPVHCSSSQDSLFLLLFGALEKAVSPADTVYQTEKAFPDSPGNTHWQPVTGPDVVPSMAWLRRFRGSLCPPSSDLCHTVNTTSSERQRPRQLVCGQTPTNCPICSCYIGGPKVLGCSVHLEILNCCSYQQGQL